MNLTPEQQAQYEAYYAQQQQQTAVTTDSAKSMLREKLDQIGKERGTNAIPYSYGSGVGATLQSLAASLEGNIRRAGIGAEQIFGDQSPQNQYMLAQAAEQSNAQQQDPARGIDMASFIGGSLPAMAAQALAMRAGVGFTSSAIGSTALDSFFQPAENMSDRFGNAAVGAGIAGLSAPLVGLASDAVSKAFGVGTSKLSKEAGNLLAPMKDKASALVNEFGITPRLAFFSNLTGANYLSPKSKSVLNKELGLAIENSVKTGQTNPLTFEGAGKIFKEANDIASAKIDEDFSKRYTLIKDVFTGLPPISSAPIKQKLATLVGNIKDPAIRDFAQNSDFAKLLNDMGDKINYGDMAMLKTKLGQEIKKREVSRDNLGEYKQLYKSVSKTMMDALENSGQSKNLGIVKYNGEELPAFEFAKKVDADYGDEITRQTSVNSILGKNSTDQEIFKNFQEYASDSQMLSRVTKGFEGKDIGALKATALDSLGKPKGLAGSDGSFDFEEFHKNWNSLPDNAKKFLTKKTGEGGTETLLPTYKQLNDITSFYSSLKDRGVFRLSDGPEGDFLTSSIRKFFTTVSQSETLASQFVKASDKMVENNNPKALLDLADKLNIKLPADVFFSQQIINAFNPDLTMDTKAYKQKLEQDFYSGGMDKAVDSRFGAGL